METILHAKCEHCFLAFSTPCTVSFVEIQELIECGWSIVFPTKHRPPVVYCPSCSELLAVRQETPIAPEAPAAPAPAPPAAPHTQTPKGDPSKCPQTCT